MNNVSFPLLFEGVEKKLEIKYIIPAESPLGGLREIDAQDWSYLLNSFGCQILNSIKNDHFDAYLLSESSLFVYRDKVVLKTCGTTRLLSCLPLLDQYARNAFEGESLVKYALFLLEGIISFLRNNLHLIAVGMRKKRLLNSFLRMEKSL